MCEYAISFMRELKLMGKLYSKVTRVSVRSVLAPPMAYVSAADVIAGGGQLEPISVHELESFTNRLEHALNGAPTDRKSVV